MDELIDRAQLGGGSVGRFRQQVTGADRWTLRMRYRLWTWLAIVALMTILFVVCAWVGNMAAEPASEPPGKVGMVAGEYR